MNLTVDELNGWLLLEEDEHLEFKRAENNFDLEELLRYCVALANEGGGRLVLGVTNEPPRNVVGSRAFQNLEQIKAKLVSALRLRIEAEVIQHPNGRVVVFHVPRHPLGVPLDYKGAYLVRAGESVVSMTHDQLKKIFEEAGPDFSAEICQKSVLTDLDPRAIETFKAMWRSKSGNPTIAESSNAQLLIDSELMTSDGLTYACLILLGTRQALGRLLPQAEVVFEYRPNRASGPAAQRISYREGAFIFLDELWNVINLRNEAQHFQQGLFIRDIPTFGEVAIREAVLNAVSHRDYKLTGSVFVRQYPRELEIVSPGGFPAGITTSNILLRHSPRNRRIAEAFEKCGLVERAGQGMNRIYEDCIRASKPVPDFAGTDEFQVSISLHGEIQDPRFIEYLEAVSKEKQLVFTTEDLLVLDQVHNEAGISDDLKPRLKYLVEKGVAEQLGRGRGTRYILSRRFYKLVGEKGAYTRKRGLDRDTNKVLLLKHICDNAKEGSRFEEFTQILQNHSRNQLKAMLRELVAEGKIHVDGVTRGARWFPGPPQRKPIHQSGNSPN